MMVPIAAAQALLLGYYGLVIGPEYYFFFYFLPLATLYQAQIRLRSASEHSFETRYNVASRGRWLSQSANANFLERLIIGPLCSDYHFEHHLLPIAPYYNLRHILERKGIEVPLGISYATLAPRARTRFGGVKMACPSNCTARVNGGFSRPPPESTCEQGDHAIQL